MRTLTTNAYNKTQTQYATEPVLILGINWSNGTQYYGDKTFTLAPNSIQGKLLEFSPIQATGKQESSGQVSSASVTLDDVDGTLKVLWNTIVMEGTLVTVYQHYEGNSWADLVLVFRGRIGGTIEWDEGERKLTFDIESYIDDAEVGYAPEEGEIADLNPDAIGVMWPIVFGGVLRLKAIPVKKGATTNNTDGILGGWPVYDGTPFEVKDGSKFPQNTVIDIVVNATRFTGYFNGNIFHRSISNLLWFENVPIVARLQQDPDTTNNKVCWVADGYNLAQKQCWLGPGGEYNFCERQEGNKCYFIAEWSDLLTSGQSFVEVRGNVAAHWFSGLSSLNWWYIKPQCQVYQYNKGYPDLYIVNEYPSSQVVEVMAKRTYDGKEIFVQVPSSYYTIHYNYSIGSRSVTAIEFPTALSSRENEQWKDDIFVSVRSSLPSNVADIIQWLVQTYTSYGIDTDSFNQARLDVAPYPANFALFSQRNVLDLIEDIAWQARCAIFLHNGVISLKYLSKHMTPNYTMTRSDILLKSLVLGFIPTEELITKLTGTWKIDYSGDDYTEKKIVYKNNIDLFGLRSEDKDIFIYNMEDLVRMTVYFWGYRYSNSWRITQYPTLLKTLALELFDCVSHSIPIISAYTLRGIIEDISHDSNINEISIRTVLCSKAAQHLGGEPIEDAYFFIGDPAFMVAPRPLIDPLTGRQIIDYIVPIIDDNKTRDNNTPTVASYKFVFLLPTQDEIERGVNFPVKIQLQDMAGKRLYSSVSAKLSLSSEDQADRLSGGSTEKSITLINGEYSVTNEQITGGTTEQYAASLVCVDSQNRDNYVSGTSETFKIIMPKTGTLVWATGPSGTIARGTNFTVQITGGVEAEVIDVSLMGLDLDDYLYTDTDNLIETITLGPSGIYNGSWHVVGGGGTETGVKIRLSDSRYNKYANSDSSAFNIPGTTIVKQLIQAFAINPIYNDELDPNDNGGTSGGGLILNPPSLEFTFTSGSIDNNKTFRLKARLLDSNGLVIDFNDNIGLLAYDANTTQIQWLAPVAGMQQIRPMVSGVMEEDFSFSITDLNLSPVTIYAVVIYNDEEYFAKITKELSLLQHLEQEVGFEQHLLSQELKRYRVETPLNITRGVSFNTVITALDDDGRPDTAYIPHGATLTPWSSDGSDVVTPISIPDIDWSNGQVTVAFTLTGGSGKDTLRMTATEEHFAYYGTGPDIGVGTGSTVISTDYWRATWTGVDSWSGEADNVVAALANAYVALQSSPRVVYTGAPGYAESSITAGGDDWDYGGGDSAGATNRIMATRYNITDQQKLDVLSARMEIRVMGATIGPGFSHDKTNQGAMIIGCSDTEPNNFSDLVSLIDNLGNNICYGGYTGRSSLYGGGGWTITYVYDQWSPPYTPYNFFINIPITLIQNMTGNKLYIWFLHMTNTLDKGQGTPVTGGGHNGTLYTCAGAQVVVGLTIQT